MLDPDALRKAERNLLLVAGAASLTLAVLMSALLFTRRGALQTYTPAAKAHAETQHPVPTAVITESTASDWGAPAVPTAAPPGRANAAKAVNEFVAAIRAPDRVKLQSSALMALEDDPSAAKELLSALHGRKAAEDSFGDDAPSARVVGLALLRDMAKKGDAEPLRSHILQLRDELLRGTDLNKAAEKDFVDMIADYTECHDANALAADPQAFLAAVGFQGDLARYYRRGLFLALQGVLTEERYHDVFGFLYKDKETVHGG